MFPQFWEILSHDYYFLIASLPFSPEISTTWARPTHTVRIFCLFPVFRPLDPPRRTLDNPSALSPNSAIFSQLWLPCCLASIINSYYIFYFQSSQLFFLICRVIFYNLHVHLSDFFKISLNTKLGVIWESACHNSNIWSPRGSVCCLWSLLNLTPWANLGPTFALIPS